MHSARVITILICIAVTVLLLIWDSYCMVNSETGDTVSEVIRAANVWSGGLIALCSAALWIHWFCPTIWE